MPTISKKRLVPSPAEKANQLRSFQNSLKGSQYERQFTPASLELASSMFYPRDAQRLENRFCRMIEEEGAQDHMDFGDLVQFAPNKTDRDLALVLLVASNLCLLK